MGVIYLRTNLVNGKQYVGQTGDIETREKQFNRIRQRYANKILTKDRQKYGLENFKIDILAETDNQEEAWSLEQKYIIELKLDFDDQRLREKEIETGMQQHGIQIQYFLYPNNHDDGDIEILIESAARHDLHSVFFDCFHDYEKCVSGAKDANGNPLYNTPNLKGKLHTYISSQQLTKKQRDKLGSGDWLFDNPNYWNLDVNTLQPLKDFLEQNLK